MNKNNLIPSNNYDKLVSQISETYVSGTQKTAIAGVNMRQVARK
jgi:hypothetical protein